MCTFWNGQKPPLTLSTGGRMEKPQSTIAVDVGLSQNNKHEWVTATQDNTGWQFSQIWCWANEAKCKEHTLCNSIAGSSKLSSTNLGQYKAGASHSLKYFEQATEHPLLFTSNLISHHSLLSGHCSYTAAVPQTLCLLLPQGLCSNCSFCLECSSSRYLLG